MLYLNCIPWPLPLSCSHSQINGIQEHKLLDSAVQVDKSVLLHAQSSSLSNCVQIPHISRILRSHNGGCVESCLLGYNAVWTVDFQRTTINNKEQRQCSRNSDWLMAGRPSGRIRVPVMRRIFYSRFRPGLFWGLCSFLSN
jgi:hypothetical protein